MVCARQVKYRYLCIGRGESSKTPRVDKTPHGRFSETFDHNFFKHPVEVDT